MNAVQIVKNLLMKLCKLFIETYNPVSFALAALFFVRTIAAIFALVKLFCSSVFVSSYRSAPKIMKFFSVWTNRTFLIINREINRSIRVIYIFLILACFFVHGEFHVFFHSMLFTVKIIVETSVACIGNRIFGIFSINAIEFFHQRHKAIHVRCILLYVIYSDILVAYPKLNIVARKKLIVSHIILFHAA